LKEDLPLSKLKDDKKLKTRLDEAEQIIMCDLETFQKPRSSSETPGQIWHEPTKRLGED